MSGFRDDFTTLDESVWTPSYLPAWSSRLDAAADGSVTGEGLHLRIPPGHPVWCADLHEPPLQVSAVQSGNWSGPVGSIRGQQPFRDGLLVREEQPEQWGWTPRYGRIEVTCRAELDRGSMFSAWLVGREVDPEECGEICIVEVFGDAIEDAATGPTAAYGNGIHRFRDPRLVEDFAAPRIPLEVRAWHRYSVDWTPTSVTFALDGRPVRSVRQAPAYPMQLILAVLRFPERAAGGGGVPSLTVREVRGD